MPTKRKHPRQQPRMNTVKAIIDSMAYRLQALLEPAPVEKIRKALAERKDGSVHFLQCAEHEKAMIQVICEDGERFISCPQCIQNVAAIPHAN